MPFIYNPGITTAIADSVDIVAMYRATLDILGSTGVLFVIGDADREATATTFTTFGGLHATATYSEDPDAWDTAINRSGQGLVAALTFNGTDEVITLADDTYFSRGDGASDSAFSCGAWVNLADTAAVRTLLAKWETTGTAREWKWEIDATEKQVVTFRDESAVVDTVRTADAAVATLGSPVMLGFSYDGAGGATASDTVTIYEDGASVAATSTNNASYVAMENDTGILEIGRQDGDTSYFTGTMYGHACLWYAQAELTADQWDQLYYVQRQFLGV